MLLEKNEKIIVNSRTVLIKDLLGEGGQGEVYLISDNNKDYALKIYKEKPSEDFIFNLKNNINKGSPSNKFLWPKEYFELNEEVVGYIMDIRPKNYVGFANYLNGKTFINKRVMLEWCLSLCQSFKKLHEKGYSYQDLNDGSLFLDPMTGDLLICDNDNVTADKKNLGILGMMRFEAPEIVRGEMLPDIHSDRFSLSVILFMTLCLGDPFEGERLQNYNIKDEEADKELYGTNPIYIYSKNDSSNRPIRGYHTAVLKRYPLLPSYIQDAFQKTFVDGLKDRENSRVTEIEWISLLNKFSDELITCSCGSQYCISVAKGHCPSCNAQTREYTTLNIGKQRILLEPGKKIYMTHIDKYSSEYSKVIGLVIQNKNNPNLWGIRVNLDTDILVKDIQDVERTIKKDGVIPIVHLLKIKFSDKTIGEIKRSGDVD